MKINKQLLLVYDNKFPFIRLLTGDEIFDHAFAEATDETKRRAKCSIEELAKEYAEAETKKDRATCILIEHIINTRLLSLQNRVTLISTVITAGATLGVGIIGFFLGANVSCP